MGRSATINDAGRGRTLTEEILSHHGVKGMHWGVRRTPQQLGHPKKMSKDARQAGKHAKTVQKHGTHALSNDEFNVLVKRMRLEEQYIELTTKQKERKAVSRGKKLAGDILVQFGKKQAVNGLNYAFKQGLKKALS